MRKKTFWNLVFFENWCIEGCTEVDLMSALDVSNGIGS